MARSYSTAGNAVSALALTNYAHGKVQECLSVLSVEQTASETSSRNIVVSKQEIGSLSDLLKGELQRYRALVEVSNFQKSSNGHVKGAPLPLVERLLGYPSEGVDLEKIVAYPPKTDAIPVKPLFLDAAWNYINYPAKHARLEQKGKGAPVEKVGHVEEESKPQKRGWFGFGR